GGVAMAGGRDSRGRMAARVESDAALRRRDRRALKIDAAPRPAVLVNEHDRRSRAALLAVDPGSVGASDRLHRSLPCDTSMIMRVSRYRRGSIESSRMYSASFECAPKPCSPKRSRVAAWDSSAANAASVPPPSAT